MKKTFIYFMEIAEKDTVCNTDCVEFPKKRIPELNRYNFGFNLQLFRFSMNLKRHRLFAALNVTPAAVFMAELFD